MDQKCRRIISKFSKHLKKSIDQKKIRPLVEKRQIFTKTMLDDVYDPLNNGDLFYDLLCTRGPCAFSKFLNILSQTGHTEEATLLQNEYSKDYSSVPYKMTSDIIGFCLIVNNKQFDSLTSRTGSFVDTTPLEDLFESLGYIVIVALNLKGEDMENCLREFSQNPQFSQVDSIVVFILSDGKCINNSDALLGTDNKRVYIKDIFTMFDNNNCPDLLGKPKMFFFQACRAGLLERENVSSDSAQLYDCVDGKSLNIVHHPSMTDMIIVHSTLPYHNHEESSWLWQDIVEVFSLNYLYHDLETMLKSVCKKMEERISSDNTKHTIHVELYGVTGIVKFSHNS